MAALAGGRQKCRRAINITVALQAPGGGCALRALFYATADEAVAYMFYRCFFLLFFRPSNMRQPFSGTGERIFMKLSPNDRGEM